MRYTHNTEKYEGIRWTSLSLDERNEFLEASYEECRRLYPQEFVPDYPTDTEELRSTLLEDFRFKRTMPVEEYTLWTKWNEIQTYESYIKN